MMRPREHSGNALVDRALARYAAAKGEQRAARVCLPARAFDPLFPAQPAATPGVQQALFEAREALRAQVEETRRIQISPDTVIKPRRPTSNGLRDTLERAVLDGYEPQPREPIRGEELGCCNAQLALKAIPILLKELAARREEMIEDMLDEIILFESRVLAHIEIRARRTQAPKFHPDAGPIK